MGVEGLIRRIDMSRVFEAKQEALSEHPEDREKAIDLFLGYIYLSESNFKYDFNQSAEEYIFGDELVGRQEGK